MTIEIIRQIRKTERLLACERMLLMMCVLAHVRYFFPLPHPHLRNVLPQVLVRVLVNGRLQNNNILDML